VTWPVRSLLVLDLVVVVAFAAAGRSSHADGITVIGVTTTATPFLAGTVLGWFLARAGSAPVRLRTGVVVWAAAVAGGLLLRAVGGDSPAGSFVVVTAVVLGIGQLGWRLLVPRSIPRTLPP
jgi:hypothetical protein